MTIFSGMSALPLPKITNETWTRVLNRSTPATCRVSVMIRIPFSFPSSGRQFGGADEIHDENDNETQAADIMNVAPSDCQNDKAKVVEVATTKATRVHCVHSEF